MVQPRKLLRAEVGKKAEEKKAGEKKAEKDNVVNQKEGSLSKKGGSDGKVAKRAKGTKRSKKPSTGIDTSKGSKSDGENKKQTKSKNKRNRGGKKDKVNDDDNDDRTDNDDTDINDNDKDSKQGKKKGNKKNKDKDNGNDKETLTPGVIYLGHIPHGFFEDQMKGYFEQFGEVTRLRLCRSLKTGRSKGYAFVEFADEEVAGIAAKAMDGYLMHGVRMVASVVPQSRCHRRMFSSTVKPDRTFIRRSVHDRKELLRRLTDPAKVAVRSQVIKKNLKKKKARLDKMQLTYKFPTVIKPEDLNFTSDVIITKSGDAK